MSKALRIHAHELRSAPISSPAPSAYGAQADAVYVTLPRSARGEQAVPRTPRLWSLRDAQPPPPCSGASARNVRNGDLFCCSRFHYTHTRCNSCRLRGDLRYLKSAGNTRATPRARALSGLRTPHFADTRVSRGDQGGGLSDVCVSVCVGFTLFYPCIKSVL